MQNHLSLWWTPRSPVAPALRAGVPRCPQLCVAGWPAAAGRPRSPLPAKAAAAAATAFDAPQFDVKNKRYFLKRIKADGLAAEQLYPGAVVTILARQLQIKEFGDDATRRACEARTER